MKNEKKTIGRSRTRRRIRRSTTTIGENYPLQHILQLGISGCKSSDDLRNRQRKLADDNKMWELIEDIVTHEKQRDALYNYLRKHMEKVYGRP